MKTVEKLGIRNVMNHSAMLHFVKKDKNTQFHFFRLTFVCHFNCNFRLMMILQQESAWLIIDFLL